MDRAKSEVRNFAFSARNRVSEAASRLYEDKKCLIVLVTWLIITVTSIPFDRISLDEVFYYLDSVHILTVGPYSYFTAFVPQALGAVALTVCRNFLIPRFVSAIAVLVTSVMIYKMEPNKESFASAMLFLTSFYTIRYGFRFFLDPFGALFIIVSIYFVSRSKGCSSGLSCILSALSTVYAIAIIPGIMAAVRVKGTPWMRFIGGVAIAAAFGLIWILLSSGFVIQETLFSVNALVASSSSWGFANSGLGLLKSWIQFILVSPLAFVGLWFAVRRRDRLVFYPMVLSFVSLSLIPGFLHYGGATEYPYISNALVCMAAGSGLETLYHKIRPHSKSFVKVMVVVLIIQFTAQSYFATSLNVNHEVGVEDYGYWYDQGLLSYMNTHYTGGRIYSSISVGLLDQRLASNWTMIEGIRPAITDNPQWLITYASYATIERIPQNTTVVEIGPYLIVHRTQTPLASFLLESNPSGLFQSQPQG